MAAPYIILGRKVLPHQLAITCLSTVGLLVFAGTRGGDKSTAPKIPPINASNDDEEKFILDFLKKQEAETPKH